jgi:hypothetical protein
LNTLKAPDSRKDCIIIIIMLPNQAIASTPSAPRPSGALPERKREHCSIMFATITHIPSLHKILSITPRNHLAPPPATPNIIRHKTQQLGRSIRKDCMVCVLACNAAEPYQVKLCLDLLRSSPLHMSEGR